MCVYVCACVCLTEGGGTLSVCVGGVGGGGRGVQERE